MANAALGRVLLAALGIIAYKNRDRLGELFRPKSTDPNAPQAGKVDPLDQMKGGLGELLDRFRNVGIGDAVDSWLGKGPNQPLDTVHVESAIDPETIESLAEQTGMSRDELLRRLAIDLPEAVDELSPNGQLPPAPQEEEPTLLDPAPPIAPKTSGASVPDAGFSRSQAADRNAGDHRHAGVTPRPTDEKGGL